MEIKTLDEMVQIIQEWAKDRAIDDSTMKDQLIKLYEELGELSKAIVRDDLPEIEDAMGDALVVLITLHMILSKKEGQEFTLLSTLKKTYDILKDRKGKLIDGFFVKEEDLKKMGIE